MYNIEMYVQHNYVQRNDAVICLEKHASKIKWKRSHNKILDIGCGDGSLTSKTLKKYLPTDFKLIGCDINENMVKHANKHNADEQTAFMVLDIAGKLPTEMRGNFDHVFSFHVLHWTYEQERAFKNIYNLLEQDGQCILMLTAWNPVFQVYRILARNNKWAMLLKDAEKYVSPYQNSQEPEKDIKKMVENIGFINVDVECKELFFAYDNKSAFKKAMIAVSPFNIPEDMFDDYFEDYFNALRETNPMENDSNELEQSFKLRYNILLIYGQKPNTFPKSELLN